MTRYNFMPTYEYECRACHHTFEKFQSMSDEPEKVCPECGGAVRRMIGGGTGVIFKGSGFYITDSKKSSSASTKSSAPAASCAACAPSAKKESA
ncbi:MAG: FmdB family zinc ribbon protein [Spirochaetales bacterium]